MARRPRFVNLEAGYATHPKTLSLTTDGVTLDVMAMCYTRTNKTDGFIPSVALCALFPPMRRPEKAAALLVAVGRWEPVEGGWRIVGWLDRNPSEAQLSERGKAAADARWMQAAPPPHAPGMQTAYGSDAYVDVDVDKDTSSSSSGLSLVPPNPDDDEQFLIEARRRFDLEVKRGTEMARPEAYFAEVLADVRENFIPPPPTRPACPLCRSGWRLDANGQQTDQRCDCTRQETA